MIDPAVLETRNARARAWFDALRDRIVAAWGVSGAYQARADAVVRLFGKRELWCLGTTQAGHPRHPLYVAGDQKLVRFKPKV